MGHYSESNIEKLKAAWLLLDGELKQKNLAKKFEDFISRKNKLHDAVAAVIDDCEVICAGMESDLAPEFRSS